MAKAAAKARTPDGNLKTVKVEVRHNFTEEEWKENTAKLTEAIKDVELKEEAVKATQATAKAVIKQLKADVNELANRLRNGYVMQQVDATVEFNKKKAIKRYYHHAPGKPTHGALIAEAAMTEDDFQQLFPPESTDEPQPEPQPEPEEKARVHSGDEAESETV